MWNYNGRLMKNMSFMIGRWRIVICSRKTNYTDEKIWGNHVSVDKIYTSENQRCYKPDVRFYNRIIDDNDFLPDEFLFVGDTGSDDIIGPKSVGMKTAFVDRDGCGAEYGQDYTIKRLDELLALLDFW